MSEQPDGSLPQRYWLLEGNRSRAVDGGVIHESMLSIHVNGQELATLMCSPIQQEALAIGFLYSEGLIESREDIGHIQLNATGALVDVILHRDDFEPPRRLILTSGCGGGVMLSELSAQQAPLESEYCTTPAIIHERMRDLQAAARLYNAVRGVHTAILANESGLLVSAEDVGRHNAVDKCAGLAVLAGFDTRDTLLLTSGRISSEMLGKARRLRCPIVASRTAPTSSALHLARAWGICVVGYLRRGSLRVYTHAERLGLPIEEITDVMDPA